MASCSAIATISADSTGSRLSGSPGRNHDGTWCSAPDAMRSARMTKASTGSREIGGIGHATQCVRHHGGMDDDTTDEASSPVAPLARSRHISVWIDADPDAVYAFAADRTELPRWAAGLADPTLSDADVEFAPPNEFGVVDHVVRLPSGDAVYNPMRVIPARQAGRRGLRSGVHAAPEDPASPMRSSRPTPQRWPRTWRPCADCSRANRAEELEDAEPQPHDGGRGRARHHGRAQRWRWPPRRRPTRASRRRARSACTAATARRRSARRCRMSPV